LLDQLVTGPMTAESVDAVMRKFKKAILERALGAEIPITWATRQGTRSRSVRQITAMAVAARLS